MVHVYDAHWKLSCSFETAKGTFITHTDEGLGKYSNLIIAAYSDNSSISKYCWPYFLYNLISVICDELIDIISSIWTESNHKMEASILFDNY